MDCDINASKYRCLGLSGYPASSCFAIFHSIAPSAEIQCSGLLESRALKFGMFLWGVPAGPAEPWARGVFGLVGDLSQILGVSIHPPVHQFTHPNDCCRHVRCFSVNFNGCFWFP